MAVAAKRHPSASRHPGAAKPRFLYSHSLLRALPRGDWARLQEDAKPVLFPKGDSIFLRGDPPIGCFWLRKGVVKISVVSGRGEERILALLGTGTTFGEPALLEDAPRAVNAYALTDCQLLLIERSAFATLLRNRPDAAHQLVRILSSEIRLLAEEAVVISFLSVRARVCRVLLQLAASIGRPAPHGRIEIVPPIRHSDLAAMASVTRESVSRFIHQWRREGLLFLSPDGTLVFNEKEVEEVLAEEINPPPASVRL